VIWDGGMTIWALGPEIDFGDGNRVPFDEVATLTDPNACMKRFSTPAIADAGHHDSASPEAGRAPPPDLVPPISLELP
jgi:hypothetical protein